MVLLAGPQLGSPFSATSLMLIVLLPLAQTMTKPGALGLLRAEMTGFLLPVTWLRVADFVSAPAALRALNTTGGSEPSPSRHTTPKTSSEAAMSASRAV